MPRPLPLPRPERGKLAQRHSGGGRRGGAGGAPAPGALPAGERAGSWSGKFQAGGRVSPALPSHTAPQRRFSPPPGSFGRTGQTVRAISRRAADRGLRSRLRAAPVGATAPRRARSGAFARPRRGRAALRRVPRCAPAAGRLRRSAHCSSGPSLSPPSSASRPSLLPPQVPPSLVTGRCINPLPRRIPPPRETLVLWPPGRDPAAACRPLGLRAPAVTPPRSLPPSHRSHRLLSSLSLPAGPSMSEKRVEEAPAELSAKERKEKKEKLEEKAVHKEKKKEIVEDEENGADEDDEENPDDVDEEEGGDEDEEGDENGQEQDGHAEKRSAEEEEDEVDPKRQKTENGSSA
ncbi:parathymosin [Pithys albifrons albifrons]|uniref:parathymosin n=2 Tax=Passeriformes TaxID=9126 RepID=UPI003A5D0EE7